MIVKVVVKVVRGAPAEDVRSDDEDDDRGDVKYVDGDVEENEEVVVKGARVGETVCWVWAVKAGLD
ncbi:hypothetical protein HDU86_006656 [Geranomyces michiganensis]|nr:hypothetical protein HDU86_006656 [Geranomyces michiganensis]